MVAKQTISWYFHTLLIEVVHTANIKIINKNKEVSRFNLQKIQITLDVCGSIPLHMCSSQSTHILWFFNYNTKFSQPIVWCNYMKTTKTSTEMSKTNVLGPIRIAPNILCASYTLNPININSCQDTGWPPLTIWNDSLNQLINMHTQIWFFYVQQCFFFKYRFV